MKHVIHSADSGAVLMVPREQGMVRVYTQMGSLQPGERINRAEVTLDKMLQKTKDVVKPYRIEFPYVDWYTCYEIGQRVCDTFSKYRDHVFIAGDACHTHSPKAGQGMNVSMMDTFNLGWKLASVLRGEAIPALLHTYHLERQRTAQELIDFDRTWSAMFSGKAKSKDAEGVSPEDMRAAMEKSIKFTSGTGVVYEPNLTVMDRSSALAKNVVVGSHLKNAQVVGAYNAHSVQLQHCVAADGRWRVIVFPGDVREPKALDALVKLGDDLGGPKGPAGLYTRKDQDMDSVIQTLTVFKTPHRDVQYISAELPGILQPRKRPYNVRDVDTLLCDEPSHHDGDGKAYEVYGIDTACVVVVRPDQYVSGVFGMDDFAGIARFFAGFMRG